MQMLVMVLVGAMVGSLLTVAGCWWVFTRFWRKEMEIRLRQLHDDIGRTVETRVRRAVAESFNEPRPADILRESTWKAAKSGSDLLSDSLSTLMGRWRKTDDIDR